MPTVRTRIACLTLCGTALGLHGAGRPDGRARLGRLVLLQVFQPVARRLRRRRAAKIRQPAGLSLRGDRSLRDGRAEEDPLRQRLQHDRPERRRRHARLGAEGARRKTGPEARSPGSTRRSASTIEPRRSPGRSTGSPTASGPCATSTASTRRGWATARCRRASSSPAALRRQARRGRLAASKPSPKPASDGYRPGVRRQNVDRRLQERIEGLSARRSEGPNLGHGVVHGQESSRDDDRQARLARRRASTCPQGWKFRSAAVPKELVLEPKGGSAGRIEDDKGNIYRLTGPGQSNFVP